MNPAKQRHRPTGVSTLMLAKVGFTRARTATWHARQRRPATEGLRVFFYHRVAAGSDPLALHPDAFRAQMTHLAERGWQALDVVTALDRLYAGQLEPNTVAVTFDDGFKDVAENALDVLGEHGFSATVFISTDVIDGRARYLWKSGHAPTLSWEEIQTIDQGGCLRFESHGLTHTNLTRLDDLEAAREIAVPKTILEARLGRACRAFCYPGGFVGSREQELVARFGYDYGISCEPGENSAETDRRMIRRIQVYGTDRLDDFAAKLEGSHDRPLPGRSAYRRLRYGGLARPHRPLPDTDITARFAPALADRLEPPAMINSDPCSLVVSIVNHGATERTVACLDSIFRDTSRRASIRVVVVDNDTDSRAGETIEAAHPEVVTITQRFRDGFGANHNRVIQSTRSRHVLVLNNDTTLPPGTIDALVDYLDAHPQVGIVGPAIVHDDGVAQHAAFGFPSPLNSVLFALTLGQFRLVQSGSSTPKKVDSTAGAAMAIRRAALERVGFFDDGFFMYHEDTDLCLRLQQAGYEAHHVPSIRVVHDHWGATRHLPEERIDEAQRSRRRYWAKHHSRLGEMIARSADASRYLAAAAIAKAVVTMPSALRPPSTREWNPDAYLYNARSALRRTNGVGMRELAAEHNAQAKDLGTRDPVA